jgi:hypothetical protein
MVAGVHNIGGVTVWSENAKMHFPQNKISEFRVCKMC